MIERRLPNQDQVVALEVSITTLIDELLGLTKRQIDINQLTIPDAQTNERWSAHQLLAHFAEFPGYWMQQIEQVIHEATIDPETAPLFGRTKIDADRLAAIESGGLKPYQSLMIELITAIRELQFFAAMLKDNEMAYLGRHPTLGIMSVEVMIEKFLVDHAREHLEQLRQFYL